MITGITIGLILIAAYFNARMDLIAHGKTKHDPDEIWKYKYKNNDFKQGPKFPLSTTALVAFTDPWHMAQLLFHTSWQLAIAINMEHQIISFIVIKVMFSLVFELIYRNN